MTITVVNKYVEPDNVYCGRGSALGNPFVMSGEAQREDVCNKYTDWFYSHVDEVNFLDLYKFSLDGTNYTACVVTVQTRKLLEIFNQALTGDVNLGCFCAPKRCHCDTIKKFLEGKLEELRK